MIRGDWTYVTYDRNKYRALIKNIKKFELYKL
jgi:hypothetical protein